MEAKAHWDISHEKHPDKRQPSEYAKDKEKSFPRHSTVCDLGGGDGADSLYFLEKGHKVFLFDISPVALEKADKKVKESNFTNNFSTGLIDLATDAIPQENDFFDVVYSRLSLHYFDQVRTGEILKDIHRVLKTGGVAYIAVKSPDDKKEMEFLEDNNEKIEEGLYSGDGMLKSRFTKEQYKAILEKAGVENFEIHDYEEVFNEERKIYVKSGADSLLYLEIVIKK